MTNQHATPIRSTDEQLRETYMSVFNRETDVSFGTAPARVTARRAVYDHGVDHGFTLGVIAHSTNIAQAGDPAKHAAESIAVEVLFERDRQDAKWGEQNHPDGTGPQTRPLSGVVYGDADQAVRLAARAQFATDDRAAIGKVTWTNILLEEVFEAIAEADPTRLRTELIQVAAVAQQWAEALDRRTTAATAAATPS
jgi:hypothetical protein